MFKDRKNIQIKKKIDGTSFKKRALTGPPFYRYTEEDLPFVSYYTIYTLYRQYFDKLL